MLGECTGRQAGTISPLAISRTASICQNNDWASCLPTTFFIWFLFVCLRFFLSRVDFFWHFDDSSLWWISGLLNISPAHRTVSFVEKTPSDALHFHLINLLGINLLHHGYSTIITKTCHFDWQMMWKSSNWNWKRREPHVSKIVLR